MLLTDCRGHGRLLNVAIGINDITLHLPATVDSTPI